MCRKTRSLAQVCLYLRFSTKDKTKICVVNVLAFIRATKLLNCTGWDKCVRALIRCDNLNHLTENNVSTQKAISLCLIVIVLKEKNWLGIFGLFACSWKWITHPVDSCTTPINTIDERGNIYVKSELKRLTDRLFHSCMTNNELSSYSTSNEPCTHTHSLAQSIQFLVLSLRNI